MSSRVRGAEATIRVTVADEFAPAFGINGQLEGTFFKVKDFRVTPRTDLVEEGYIGENFDDLDIQLHGYDLAWTVDELDNAAIKYMNLLAFKQASDLAPPVITVSVTYFYREPGVLPQTVQYIGCVMKISERSIGGRKEYINNSIEAKAKDRQVLVG